MELEPVLSMLFMTLPGALVLSWMGLGCGGKKKKVVQEEPPDDEDPPPPPRRCPKVVVPKNLKPKELPKNEKELAISREGLMANKNDYPTMDDVLSDWSDDGAEKKPKRSPKKGGKKKRTK